MTSDTKLLKVEDLKVHFPITEGVIREKQIGSVKAVDGVSFDVARGETLSVVGESGCGKSTTALAILRMNPVTSGQLWFEGQDITNLEDNAMRPIRRRMQMIYQDPFGSLNPRMKVGNIIGEPLTVHRACATREEFNARVQELMSLVGLLPDMSERYPHEFSGGQRQRIAIARALALEPSLVLCDEPVSALDVSIQAQVVNLLIELQERLSLTYLFIAHDLSVVRHISDRVAVMYLGKVVEIGTRDQLFTNPRHPYTQALLAAVPVADPEVEKEREQQLIVGEVPSVRNPPTGCSFNPRCTMALPKCRAEAPELVDGVACHLVNPE